ncbi:hypothetical protein KDM41_16795, partial [bacterium]|nr:hypothetical protein [bacterium]
MIPTPRAVRVILFAIAIAALGAGLAPRARAQQYQVRTWEVADGLPGSEIKSIAQDRDGRMWFTTRSGLVSLDSVGFEKADLPELSYSESAGQLLVDPAGDVWALFSGTQAALYHWNGHVWDRHAAPPHLEGSVYSFRHGAFAGTPDGPLLATVTRRGDFAIREGGGWRECPDLPVQPDSIRTLAGADGLFYAGTSDGLYVIPATAPERAREVVLDTPSPGVMALAWEAGTRTLWVVGADWIGHLDDDGFILDSRDAPFLHIPEYPDVIAAPDRRGGLYIGNLVALYHHRPDRALDLLGQRNGLVIDGATTLFVDREGVLWQGTERGLSKLVSRRFANYTREQGLPTAEVTVVMARADGEVVLGHRHHLTFWDQDRRVVSLGTVDPRVRIIDMVEDPHDGSLWLAGRVLGLGHYTEDDGFTWERPDTPEPTHAVAVEFDAAGRLWYSATEEVFIRDREGPDRPVAVDWSPGGRPYCRVLEALPGGAMALGTTNDGVFVVAPDGATRHHRFRDPAQDRANSIYALHGDPDGTLWVGTTAGLFQARGDSLAAAVLAGEGITDPVYFVLRDAAGRLWCGASDGVYRFDGQELVHFTAETGLVGRETNRHAGLATPDGRVWIGTDRGLSIYRDDLDLYRPLAPRVVLDRLEARGQVFGLDADVSVPPGARSLVFRYRVLTTAGDSRLRTRTRLVGFDDAWPAPDDAGNQELRYTNLEPGDYRFEVQAAGSGQPWSDVVTSGVITVPGPVWQRGWFIALVAVLGLAFVASGVVLLIQRAYTRRLRAEVEGQVAENLRIQTELQRADKLRSLGVLAGGIAHDFNNLLTVILGNLSLLAIAPGLEADGHGRVETATGALHKARHLANQLLTFSRGGAPVLRVGSLADVIDESASFVLRGADVSCTSDLPDDLWPVALDSDQMNQVVNNLLLNARQAAAPGGAVRIVGRNLPAAPAGLQAGRYVEIRVEDNGPGIAPADLPHVFDPYFTTKSSGSGLGLATAYSIVERHGGRLEALSPAGGGAVL